MKENIHKVAERGESLVDLEGRSETLALNSSEFQRSATKLHKKLYWKSVRLWSLLIAILLAVLIAIIIVIVVALLATKKIWIISVCFFCYYHVPVCNNNNDTLLLLKI